MLTKAQTTYKAKKPRKKKCKECGKFFLPEKEMQTTCNYLCAIEYAKKKENKDKYISANKKEFRANNLSKSDLKLKARDAVNEYIRLRDRNKPKCISCDYRFNQATRQIHASHFRPAGQVQQLRYYTLNIWASCSICNNHKSGNLVPYRIALIEKFGLEWVENLEANHETKKYSIEYLERLILVFRKKIKLYKRKFR